MNYELKISAVFLTINTKSNNGMLNWYFLIYCYFLYIIIHSERVKRIRLLSISSSVSICLPNLCAGQILMTGGQRGAVPQTVMPQVSSVMEDEILMDLIWFSTVDSRCSVKSQATGYLDTYNPPCCLSANWMSSSSSFLFSELFFFSSSFLFLSSDFLFCFIFLLYFSFFLYSFSDFFIFIF